ncbi:MAG: HlyD family efflux transporter periplasmic adaptor subunit [Eubacteriales bacterium]|nr:HlyD family efflux transporter periplasmic adaptor subunit [Eubacteriales bacterium]
MIRNKSNKKIVRYKRHMNINIGTILFGLIFIYMIINFILYITNSHVTIYEVTAGPLSGNYHFTALALKDEQIVTAEESGTVSYYAKEGSKVGKGNSIYSINDGRMENVLSSEEDTIFSTKDLSGIRNEASAFSENFREVSFQNVYNFKSNIQGSILDLVTEKTMDRMNESGDISYANSYTAPQAGIIVYSVDNYENISESDITMEMFDQKNYIRTNLRSDRDIQMGEPVYKLLTSEDWSLIIPLTDKDLGELSGMTQIRFRFLKDGTSFNSDFSIIQNGDQYFGKLDISNSLIRFAADRFIEIELIVSRQTGLKIPNSALAVKEFFEIPKEFAKYEGENPSSITLTRETYANDGSAVVSEIEVPVYREEENSFYVDDNVFQLADYVLKGEERFQILESEELTGVYNVNMGYAVFREVEVLDSNEEYSIVKAEDVYSLSQYDHIVLDASDVTENQIIF